MTDQQNAPRQGLALPLAAVEVSTPGSWDFGWCVVDANKRVLGYCMTEAQAKQLAAPFATESETARTYEQGLEHVLQGMTLPEGTSISDNDRRWRTLEHGCQWVSFTETNGETHSFDPRNVSTGFQGDLQSMRAFADEIHERQMKVLRDGIKQRSGPEQTKEKP